MVRCVTSHTHTHTHTHTQALLVLIKVGSVRYIGAGALEAAPHPVTGGSFIGLSEFALLPPHPQPALTNTLQVVGSERQLGRRRRHGAQEAGQQCIDHSGKHVDGNQRALFVQSIVTSLLRLTRLPGSHCWTFAALPCNHRQGAGTPLVNKPPTTSMTSGGLIEW